MARQFCGFILAACALSLGAGCATSAYGPIPGRGQAPAQYTVAPKKMSINHFPEFTAASTAWKSKPGPALPPLPALNYGNGRMGIRPIEMQVGREGSAEMKPVVPGKLSAEGLHPMAQLVYGGEHPEYERPGEYQFRVRDKIRIHVRDHEEFSDIVEVTQEGFIQIPNTDIYITAKDLTRKEVELAVAAKVAPFIKGQAVVRVIIELGQGGYYYIFGEVRDQGRFPMGVTPTRLSEAVFRANSEAWATGAGGEAGVSLAERLRQETEISPRASFTLPKYAYLAGVSIITPHRSHPTRRVYNVKDALYQGKTGQDPFIRNGQIIFVPSTTDKRVIEFFRRVIAPIRVLTEANDELGEAYGRITGNSVRGSPTGKSRVKKSGLLR